MSKDRKEYQKEYSKARWKNASEEKKRINREKTKLWRLANPDKQKEMNRLYREKHPRKFRHYHLKKTYGITVEQYDKMFKEQNGVCAICNQQEPIHDSLAVDHSHKTNAVRSLLCTKCNLVLGQLNESVELLQKSIDYLNKWNNVNT